METPEFLNGNDDNKADCDDFFAEIKDVMREKGKDP